MSESFLTFISLISVLLTIMVIVAIILGSVFDLWDRWRLPKETRFLLLPIPFPPVDERVFASLTSLRLRVLKYESSEYERLVKQYVNAIDMVLMERSRESLLRLHAMRKILRDRVIGTSNSRQ